jgi:hypothetical protein
MSFRELEEDKPKFDDEETKETQERQRLKANKLLQIGYNQAIKFFQTG